MVSTSFPQPSHEAEGSAGALPGADAAPPAARHDAEVQPLESLVLTRLRLLQHLRAQVAHQQRLIADDDMDQLLRLLSDKQRCLAGLQQVEQMLKQRGAHGAVSRDPSWQACRQHWAQCDALAREILDLEQAAADALQRRRDAATGQLRAVNGAQAAQAAYTAQHELRGSQLDLTSES